MLKRRRHNLRRDRRPQEENEQALPPTGALPLPLPEFDAEQHQTDQAWSEYLDQIRESGPDNEQYLLDMEEDE